MIEKYESENSMMKYQIIFLKFQNFLYKIDKVVNKKVSSNKTKFFENLKKKTLISKLNPMRNYLGAKKGKFMLSKLSSIANERKFRK
jgi:hypothetical protein